MGIDTIKFLYRDLQDHNLSVNMKGEKCGRETLETRFHYVGC